MRLDAGVVEGLSSDFGHTFIDFSERLSSMQGRPNRASRLKFANSYLSAEFLHKKACLSQAGSMKNLSLESLVFGQGR
ncbi:MAG: hypothetical protein C4519_14930 [Desulfobacteraceae bacterium]|nr:MAG: hypothetical protein C4519_14930 [Desulfobacteraceae bacterium]